VVPTHSLNRRVTGSISLEIKRLGLDANYSLPSSAEVGNDGVILPLPHMYSLCNALFVEAEGQSYTSLSTGTALHFTVHRDNFTLHYAQGQLYI
jgi:hypothetical protein